MEIKKFYAILVVLVIISEVSGILIGESFLKTNNIASDIQQKTENNIQTTGPQYIGDPPASLGNPQDYLINPVFPAHTIASQYGYVTYGNGRVFIGGLYTSGNGYLAGAKGAAVIASMLSYQPLTSYDYYLYITAPSPINVGGAVKTDSATVMFMSSMLGQESSLNKSMYFLGDVGLEGYMYSTGVVYQRIVQLYQGGVYYLVVPQMMALAEGKNYQMAQNFAIEHHEVLLTVNSIPQMYELITGQQLPQPQGYIDFPVNFSVGYNYLSQLYSNLSSEVSNETAKNEAQQYWLKAEGLASEGDYYAFYSPDNPAVQAIQILYKYDMSYNISSEVDKAISAASSYTNLWKIETAAEAAYLSQGNISDKIDANAWAALSLSINVGPSIIPYGFYEGLYNAYVIDMYAAEYYDSVTGSSYGNVTLLTDVYENPNLLYDYGFFANYYAQLALNFSNYYLKQLNGTALQEIEQSIYQYMTNEDNVLENAAAYYDGPSIVGYIMMQYGQMQGNVSLLYYAMPYIRMTMNIEQLTWYNSD
ncbi:serine protease [Acidianus sulfidivorans JP7]|uniref:Serine protease n=1 Tax=Acidianus sulfidivorans JP7 TaxID=619593 RepID=A0A2U9IL57_9CREN|nr:serine protease [Acidianus sulfidivorans]AWR96725.1 serine protease [Acidianus sulfidivorans JP7]